MTIIEVDAKQLQWQQVTVERLLTPGATIPLLREQQDAGVLRVLEVCLQTRGSQHEVIRTKPQSKTRSAGAAPSALACQDSEAVSWSDTVSASSGMEWRNEAKGGEELIWDHANKIKGGEEKLTGEVIWDHDIADSSGSAQLVCLVCEIAEHEWTQNEGGRGREEGEFLHQTYSGLDVHHYK
jgi:hypothetical protein